MLSTQLTGKSEHRLTMFVGGGEGGGGGHGGGGDGSGSVGGQTPFYSDFMVGPSWEPAKASERFGIAAKLLVYLNAGVPLTTVTHGVGMLSRLMGGGDVMEALEPVVFIREVAQFLDSVGITTMELAKLDSKTVVYLKMDPFNYRDYPNERNLETAVDEVTASLGSSRRDVHQVSVVATGRTEEFEIRLAMVYSRLHDDVKPGIVIRILAMPAELSRRPDEMAFEHIHRLYEALDDKARVCKLNQEAEVRMRRLLWDYRQRISLAFGAKTIDDELKVDLGNPRI